MQMEATAESDDIPQRDTVAGEATARSCTSKSMFMLSFSLMRSPFAKHNV